MTKEDVLRNCTVEGIIVRLPDIQLDRKLYMDVAKALQLIGGKWKGGKTAGFVFPSGYEDELESLINKLSGGEKLNPKKEYQFFETPAILAEKMALLLNATTGSSVLEPSAGQGALVNAVLNYNPSVVIFLCEKMITNQMILRKKFENHPEVYFLAPENDDFLDYKGTLQFDFIIANPPFAKNQDIDHIRKMYDVCKPGGRIVTISSNHWVNCENKKEKAFAEWLGSLKKVTHMGIDSGSFKESGTMVGTNILIIDK